MNNPYTIKVFDSWLFSSRTTLIMTSGNNDVQRVQKNPTPRGARSRAIAFEITFGHISRNLLSQLISRRRLKDFSFLYCFTGYKC